jgi:ribosomal protein S18 acetylase RimI-like enzyme
MRPVRAGAAWEGREAPTGEGGGGGLAMEASAHPTLGLRPATAGDARRIVELLHASYAPHLADGFNFAAASVTEEDVRGMLALGGTRVLDAPGSGGEVLGTVTLIPRGRRTLYLCWLAVAPGHKGQGHGRFLLAMAEAVARWQGARRIVLETPERHAWLPGFYRRHGYVQIGRRRHAGRRYDSAVFEKILAVPRGRGPRPAQ